ncbi:acyltransferase family protein [Halobacillus sp. K22]|uniref:acyltransferase family protein n=1 Tax=Halobacillus sp. K22 TaxID=3457431 RepID=UPI003FCEACC4
MEFSKNDIKILQGVAILMMLALHLFARKDVGGLYETFPLFNDVPLVYYFGLFGDACVPIYLFASGYGLYITMNKSVSNSSKNLRRIVQLLIRFWVILFTFLGIGLIMGNMQAFSGGFYEFFLNFFLLSNSYNGAWWYLQTYTILIILSPFLFNFIKKHNPWLVVMVSGLIYLLAYIQRIKHVIDFGDNSVVNIVVNALVLVGTSQFAFLAGAIFAEKKIYSWFTRQLQKLKRKNTLCILGIVLLIIIHSIYESMIIAPLTAISFICLFSAMDKSKFLRKVLTYFGVHSTNIWLTHMFFYMSMFPAIVFAPKYPILIYMLLIVLCLVTSYLINLIYSPLQQLIDKHWKKDINLIPKRRKYQTTNVG